MKNLLVAALLCGAAPAAAELPVGTFTFLGGTPFTISQIGETYVLSPAPGVTPAPIVYQRRGQCFVLTWRDSKEAAGQFCYGDSNVGILDGYTTDRYAADAVADLRGDGYAITLVPGGYQVVDVR
jgi:hypothetical protein